MTNRLTFRDINQENVGEYNLTNVKTCFERFKGIDIITVSRNGLILSTLRKGI